MKKIFFSVLFLFSCQSSAFADAQIGELEIGMPKDSISAAVKECEKDLCGDIIFGGETWSGRYIIENDTLLGIGIFAKTTDEFLNAAFTGLECTPYVVIYGETNSSSYNFLSNARKGKSEADMEADFHKWLEEMEQTNPSYALYLYAEPELYTELKLLPDDELESPLEADMPDVILTLLSVTPTEIRLLSGTMGMIEQRLQEMQTSVETEAHMPILPAEEASSEGSSETDSEKSEKKSTVKK